MTNIIDFKDVSTKYSKKRPILNNINLTIQKGQMVAIIGASGAGKSTLFKLIVNALNYDGDIKIFDQDLSKLKKTKKQKLIQKIGFLTQKANLISSESVYQNVAKSQTNYKNWFFKVFGLLTKMQKIEIFEKLDQLGILDKAFYRVSDLSGGQQQRVELAKLLIKKCELILADEPTSNLDEETAKLVLKILRNLANKGKTVLVNIHDLDSIKENFDRVIAIKNTRILFDMQTKEIETWQLKQAVKIEK
ncbi:ABC transporter ATP-binding protein [Mycoplasmopsis bovigenitalium]|uniref:Alkylphosphonate ABC transporter, ATP-binding protein n=2 Tax=Mycoplasmopsis bovigenitalium TaxID=2112 RepID=N9V0I4_9BACT|nr:ATP-binding cassette domain-containing protein [Mycoplasmopsis bovigenitalium]ENY68932.1 Alkylphosphonate ABC transporter, ATP-binding protein [Mycoplasmopsis bovigenitalium 51080]VEU61009.1 ABC transporter ATP-binding protein [Mycoplasmopsis bovigenitalium]